MNRTYISEKDDIKKRLIMMRDKLQKLYGYRYPIQRRVIEERMPSSANARWMSCVRKSFLTWV